MCSLLPQPTWNTYSRPNIDIFKYYIYLSMKVPKVKLKNHCIYNKCHKNATTNKPILLTRSFQKRHNNQKSKYAGSKNLQGPYDHNTDFLLQKLWKFCVLRHELWIMQDVIRQMMESSSHCDLIPRVLVVKPPESF